MGGDRIFSRRAGEGRGPRRWLGFGLRKRGVGPRRRPDRETPAESPLLGASGEGRAGDTQPLARVDGGGPAKPPVLRQLLKGVRHGDALGAEAHPPGLGGGNPLRLALADELPLGLGHVAEQLEHNVRNQSPGQVPALPGVQQRHVQHHDGDLLLPGQTGPLLQDLRIIPSQAVDALDDQYVTGLQFLHQLEVGGAGEILSGLLFNHNVLLRHTEISHGSQLPVLPLSSGGYADISVCHTSFPPLSVHPAPKNF